MPSIANSIMNLINKYEDVRKNDITVANPGIKPLYRRIEKSIEKERLLEKYSNIYMHRASGSGNLTKTPILYFFDDRETKKATHGVYVALIMYSDPASKKYGSFRLALTQGTTQLQKKSKPEQEFISKLREKSKKISEDYCESLFSRGFMISSQIELTTHASIAEKVYEADFKIKDDHLIKDLLELLHAYSEYTDSKFLSYEPSEINNPEKYFEGASKKISVNSYERDQSARKKCIDHYGHNCQVCGFNFTKQYGEIGNGFIHVHHIKPLSEINREYEIDPIKDLRPVCPNCHAMLHRDKKTLSIQKLKAMLAG